MGDSHEPQAAESMTTRAGMARFTVLTGRMIRMEWARDGKFEDRPTLAVVNRRTPAVRFRLEREGQTLHIRTDSLTLRYVDDGRVFHAGNLSVEFTLDGRGVRWRPGLKDARNLKGTCRTLDNVSGARTRLGEGLISRSGWALFDDSRGVVLDADKSGNTDKPWVAPRPAGVRRDLYLLAYGHDYKAALKDASQIFGRQPLPPRFALGYWWSRYWAYTDKEIETLVAQHDAAGVPLDVMVVDMDWHLEGWTGYTWDRRYFPDPKDFLRSLKRHGLKVTLNLHPAEGVQDHEEAFATVARALKARPGDRHVPFDCTDPQYMAAYFRHLHHPMEDDGVDFWWIDWQQGEKTAIKGLDPLPWLNHLHFNDMLERKPSRRPLILSRFGGLGAGRYPLGFSGDTISQWSSLAYQPHFTATAANVLFGYWSHDIGGHMPGQIEPELYTRWVQYGVFSPILRTHTTKNPHAERRLWEYPAPHSELMAEAIRLRYRLVPYIYTENRKCFDSGLSLCRPMYHEHPDLPKAYSVPGQYYFGDEMIVAPIVRRVSRRDEMAEAGVYLPPGKWFDTALGELHDGGRTIRRRYLISEIPVFVRGGAIVPAQKPPLRLNDRSYRDLVVIAYPGGDGRYDLYEDDGISQDYLRGQSATIRLAQRSSAAGRGITIAAARGNYKGFLATRTLEVRLPASVPPRLVKVNGEALRWSHRPADGAWSYDGDTATTIIRLRSIDLRKSTKIEVLARRSVRPDAAMGLKGLISRLECIRVYSAYLGHCRVLHRQERLPVEAAQIGNRISRNPDSFAAETERLGGYLRDMPRLLRFLHAARELKHLRSYATGALHLLDSTKRWWRTVNR